jgi:hypothetical protein
VLRRRLPRCRVCKASPHNRPWHSTCACPDLGTEEAADVRVITTVPAPVEMYDTIHRGVGATVDGLLVHIGRATTDGFQTMEVWESKEHYDRANTDITRHP